MKNDDMEMVRGSGNIFRDLDIPNPEIQQAKAILAAEIIKVLDEQKMSVRAAHDVTGFAAADFSRIRNANLQRFTVDRLMTILGRFDREIEVSVSVRGRPKTASVITAATA